MKILILDDSSEKIGAITKLINSTEFAPLITIEYSLDLQGGRSKLCNTYYDLLILDLNIPEQIGYPASYRAGADFVDEIIETERVLKPTDIIILTAFDDSATAFREKIEHVGFFILQYDYSAQNWRDSLKSRIDYLICCRQQWDITPRLPECDVVLITAVAIETSSVLSLDYPWKQLRVEDDPSIYNYAIIDQHHTHNKIRILHNQLPEMGMAAAAAISAKMIIKFKPKYVIMTGIAAGIKKELNLGDIMVGTDIWNYSSGKYKDSEEGGNNNIDLLPDSIHIPLDETIREIIINQDYDETLKEIKAQFKDFCPENDLNVAFGPIACGSAVVASDQIVREQVLAHSRKTIGLDMESYGVCFASRAISAETVKHIIIKSVSDKADKAKNDGYQKYASFTSAQFAKYLIETILDYQ